MKVLLELPDDAMEDFARLVAQHLPAASPPPPAAPSVLLPEDVAQVLRCATKRVYELKSRGELPFVKEGGRLVFMRTDVDAYLARNRHITPNQRSRTVEHYDDSSSYDGGGIEETADDWLNEDAPGEDDYDFFDDGSGRSRTRTAEDYFGPEIGDYVADIVAEQFGQAVPDSRDPRVELAGRMLDEQDAEAYQQEAIQVRDAAFVDLEHRFPEIAEPGVAAQVLDAAVQAVREAGRPELVDHPAFADVVERVFTSRSVSEWTADIDQDRMVKKLEDRPGSWF